MKSISNKNKLVYLLLLSMIMFMDSIYAQNPSQRFKRIDYDYDLVSGNVIAVHYQSGQPDEMHHKYEYDADNRITNVYTSTDSVIWEQDAKYFYYNHGPLARTELGDNKVQGLDYAYTMQGWIKGVNSNNLNVNNDIGQDGNSAINNPNSAIAKDAFGYSLGYFTGDYKAIDITKNQTTNNFVANVTAAAYLTSNAPNLFNGNISQMVTNITPPAGMGGGGAQLAAYQYDQLNRIKQMKAYRDINVSANTWGDGSTYDASYETNLTYDANGNILTNKCNGVTGINAPMDDLTYKYENIANGYTRNTNKLRSVTDNIASTNYTTDIDNQTANNYTYDEIGNLKSDAQEQIANIDWTVYGKIKAITRTTGSTKPDMAFAYDASGNRISKTVIPRDANGQRPSAEWTTTYYVRDASGNVMSTYTQANTSFKLQEQTLFGSSRLGIVNRNLELTGYTASDISIRVLGRKNYELANHLGNVLEVISDKKLNVLGGFYFMDFTTTFSPIHLNSTMTGVIENGRLRIGATTTNHSVYLPLTTIAGDTYKVTVDIDLAGSSTVIGYVYDVPSAVYGTSHSFTTNGTYSYTFTATSNSSRIYFESLVSNRFFYIDNLLVEDITVTPKATITAYKADILSATDYYAFGSIMPGRNFNANQYRYGFGSHEQDNEIKGTGNMIDMGDRHLDTRLGRTPKPDRHATKYPGISPYAYANNNPIYWMDPDGKDLYGANAADRQTVQSSLQLVLGDAQTVFAFNNDKLEFNGNYNPANFTLDQQMFIKEFNENIVSNTKIKVYVHNTDKGINTGDGGKTKLGKFEPELTIKTAPNVVDLFVNPNEKSQEGVVFDDLTKEGKDQTKDLSKTDKAAIEKDKAPKVSFLHGLGHALQFSKGRDGDDNDRKTIGFENFVRKIVGMPAREGDNHGSGTPASKGADAGF